MRYGFGYGLGKARRWRTGSGAAPAPGEIAFVWREAVSGGVAPDDLYSSDPVEIADISAEGALAFSLFADPDSKFDVVDHEDGTAVLRVVAALDFDAAASHGFAIQASNDGGSSFYADELALYKVVTDTAPDEITFHPAAVAVGRVISEDADASLPLFLGTVSANGSHPLTITKTVDADDKFSLTDHGNGTASLYLAGSVDYATADSHSVTVKAENATGDTTQEFVFTVEESTNESGLDEDDGEPISSPNFSQTVTSSKGSGKLKLVGKTSAEAQFLFNIGAPHPIPGRSYTMRYTPDFSAMSLGGKKAFIGFGFKAGNAMVSAFHSVGLKGDGDEGLLTHQIAGASFLNIGAASGTSGDAPQNGTQSGPNWQRIVISPDGETYDFYTSANGIDFVLEYSDQVPTPLADADGAVAQFGISGVFTSDDRGPFSVAIDVWVDENTIGVPVNVTPPIIEFID